jgi:hypothetical protein
MRKIFIGLSAALLAGCGSGLVQLDEGNGAGPAAGAPGAPNAPNTPGPIRPARNSREATIAACVQDLSRNLPPGTNVHALCECSVDRMIARTSQGEAVRQCAAEQRVTLPGQ